MISPKITPFSSSLAARAMVKNFFRPNRIGDQAILQAFESVSKEAFTESQLAYTQEVLNNELPPYSLAKALQGLNLSKEDVLAYLGFDSGYGPCVSSLLVSKVYAIDTKESVEDFKSYEEYLPKNLTLLEANDLFETPLAKDVTAIILSKAVIELPYEWINSLTFGQRVAFFKPITRNLVKLCIGIKQNSFKIIEQEELTSGLLEQKNEQPFVF